MQIPYCIWLPWCVKLRLFNRLYCLNPKICSFLIAGILAQLVPASEAKAQTYRYTGNMPAAKMTLDMMEVMGYIQRVPDPQYGSGASSCPMSSMMSPMSSLGGMPMSAGMMAMQNPMMAMQNPWSGMSTWPGMAAGNMMPSTPQGAPGVTAMTTQPGNGSIQVKPSDLAALLSAVQRPVAPVTPAAPAVPAAANNQLPVFAPPVEMTPSSIPATPTPELPPSNVSGSGSIVENLSGVWRGNNQDVLVITGQRFIWTDKDAKTIEGEIAVQGDKLITRLSSNGSVMAYRFKNEGDKFVAVTEAGHQYVFQRSK